MEKCCIFLNKTYTRNKKYCPFLVNIIKMNIFQLQEENVAFFMNRKKCYFLFFINYSKKWN